MEQKQKYPDSQFTTIEIPQSLESPVTETEGMVRAELDAVNQRLEKLQFDRIDRELGSAAMNAIGMGRPRFLVSSDGRAGEGEFRQSMLSSSFN